MGNEMTAEVEKKNKKKREREGKKARQKRRFGIIEEN